MARFLIVFFLGLLALLILVSLVRPYISGKIDFFPGVGTTPQDQLIEIGSPAPPSQPVTPPTEPNVAPTEEVLLYMVSLNDAGMHGEKIGCEDSLIPLSQDIPRTTNPLRQSIEALIAARIVNPGENNLYNSLAQSRLIVQDASVDAAGKATISLTGELVLGGVCDNPRVEAQLKRTALQFPSVKSVEIFVNNIRLEELLSGRG